MKEELMPFADPQQERPRRHCPRCGREIYGLHGRCIYCPRWQP